MNYIYCFTNKINDKKYIGSTIQEPNARYRQHLYYVNNKDNEGKYYYPLYCAIRKYGIENFSFGILEQKECSEEEIRNLEYQYIINYNTVAPNGYNQTTDTQHPMNDPLIYQKISETKREKAKCVAEVDSSNNVIKVWRSIVDCAEETLLDEKKIAACCRGERHSTSNRKFYWLDNSQHLIIPIYERDPYKGKKGTTQKQITNRKVQKINLETKEILDTYDSIALAARENHCDASGISKTCRGKRTKCGGFSWQYVK